MELSGNVQKYPIGEKATLMSEINSPVFIKNLLVYSGILPFLVSEEDDSERFSNVLRVTQLVD